MLWDLLIWGTLVTTCAAVYRALPKPTSKDSPDPTIETSPIQDPKQRQEKWFELVKLEYEKAAERYDNIYSATWQNFSYMAAVSAGILTFGAGKIPDDFLLVALALSPLVFWLIAIFLPMDHYGDATRHRLKAIEEGINRTYLPEATAPKLGHFILFKDTHYRWRVRHVVNTVGGLIVGGWLLCLVVAGHHGIDRLRFPTRTPALERVTAARDSLVAVTQRLDSINRMLQITVQCLSAPRPANQARPPAC